MADAIHGKGLFEALLDYPLPNVAGTRDYVFYFVADAGYGNTARTFTAVPDHWIPFVPVATEESTVASPVIELHRRAVLRINADGQQSRIDPRGILLGGGDLRLAEEEIQREGTIVERAFQHTRWFDGRSLLWLADM
ncbi:hypothetical protein ACX80V_16755 [Arthrobacter sp. MDT3-24]